eukprot:TRINITY_DN2430_c0_g1_i1.p1 TRINITY_DN2430_c0_g1~~TRINITY_DN2430_c0_g1_i1.p1  ORF type:complete len:400 (-),score=85.15 TRINITY_DN2430_c0_g1_i1:154-1353(-)
MDENIFRILIIGQPGTGKTSLYNFLTGEVNEISDGSEDITKNISRSNSFSLTVKNSSNREVEVIDSPGLNSKNVEEWWEKITGVGMIHMCIIMFNATIVRSSDISNLIIVKEYLSKNSYNCIVLGVEKPKHNNQNLDYYCYKNDEIEENRIIEKEKKIFKGNNSCIGLLDRKRLTNLLLEKIDVEIVETFAVLDPMRLIDGFVVLNQKIIKICSLIREAKIDFEFISNFQADLKKEFEKLIKKVKEFENVSQQSINNIMGYILTLKGEIEEVNKYFEDIRSISVKDVNNNNDEEEQPNTISSWNHLWSWLPFAGNVHLEKYNHIMVNIFNIIKDQKNINVVEQQADLITNAFSEIDDICVSIQSKVNIFSDSIHNLLGNILRLLDDSYDINEPEPIKNE